MKNNVSWELNADIVARHFLKNVSRALRDAGAPSPRHGVGLHVPRGFSEGLEKMKGAGRCSCVLPSDSRPVTAAGVGAAPRAEAA